MANLNLILFIAISAPIAMMLFVFKGNSRTVLSFLMIGIFTCLFSGITNGTILAYGSFDQYYLTLNVTPIVEEITKGLPILFFAFLFKPKKQLLLECALAVGVGFAILENAYILGSSEGVSVLMAVIRGFGAGMMHGICTLCVGYGMSFVHTKRKLFYTGTFALLTVAILYHSIYNALIQSQFTVVGMLLPIVTFFPILITLERKKIKNEKN